MTAGPPTPRGDEPALRAGEEGAILVLSAFLLITLFVLAALAIDIGFKSQERQWLWNTLDSAALAGAALLPDDAAAAQAQAAAFAAANDPELAGTMGVSFRCLVADKDKDGSPDAFEVPNVCDPGPSPGGWHCADGRCATFCDPSLPGTKCNTIVANATKVTDYAFAPIIGVEEGDTSVRSAACQGSCGGSFSGPVDLVMIIDRTGSMNDSNSSLTKAKEAALGVLDYFDPDLQHIGLAVLGAGDAGVCSQLHPTNGSATWLGVGLSSDYKDNLDLDIDGDGEPDLDSDSSLVNKINCLGYSSQGTNLGSPIRDTVYGRPDALTHLLSSGRPGVKKGIVLLTDGAANEPDPEREPCQYAADMAAQAKGAGIEVFTIGFGVQGDTCARDSSGSYVGAPVTRLLADMATSSNDNCSGSNASLENTDGDHFFCEPKSGDLSEVFLTAVSQLVSGSKLVDLPPGA